MTDLYRNDTSASILFFCVQLRQIAIFCQIYYFSLSNFDENKFFHQILVVNIFFLLSVVTVANDLGVAHNCLVSNGLCFSLSNSGNSLLLVSIDFSFPIWCVNGFSFSSNSDKKCFPSNSDSQLYFAYEIPMQFRF